MADCFGHISDPRRHSASGGRSGAFKSAVLCSFLFCLYSVVALLAEPLVEYADGLGKNATATNEWNNPEANTRKFLNPLYLVSIEYRARRRWVLLGLTQREAMFGRRMVASLVFGALIGLERRQSNRSAGIRTLSLISLGACVFTIASAFAFEDGTQEWDASRVSAALPSGVGFLGGALIFKDKGQIFGLTTACGIWLCCSVGICCGGGLYFPAGFATCGMVTVLRFGPRLSLDEEGDAQGKGGGLSTQGEVFPEVKATTSAEPLLRVLSEGKATVERRTSNRVLIVGDE